MLKDVQHIPDTQSARDERHVAIQRVGVRSVRYPIGLRIASGVATSDPAKATASSTRRPKRSAKKPKEKKKDPGTELVIRDLRVAPAAKPDLDILQGINLTIRKGETHAIMGPNGSGKTTLAYALMGHPAYVITQGEVIWKDMNILTLSPDKRARLGMFLAFQYPTAIPGLSVASFIRSALNAKLQGIDKNPDIDPTDASTVIDAKGAVLGRLAAQAANILRGKNKPIYTPHLDAGDFVVVINAEKVVLTGKKEEKNEYMFFSGFVGGESYRKLTVHHDTLPVIDWEITPTTPWNYGLVLKLDQPGKSIRVIPGKIGKLTDDDFRNLAKASGILGTLPIWIDAMVKRKE